ncbi:MAG: ABC transporter permease subunit [Thermincola sp.]|jgi:Cu-processing system permease protein|nr:ABC transporter permease subunit [Thermincola sp.]
MYKVRSIKVIAKKEFTETLRNSWTPVITCVFAAISVGISYFGLVTRGETGLQSFETTIASLMSMVIYIVPLIALLMGYSAVSGEREQGSLALLLTQPVSRGEVVLGKFLGLALALTCSTLVGFGITGVLILFRVGSQGWVNYVYFLLSSLCLGLVFLSMGLLISILARKKAEAAAGAIFLWFFFTFIFDMMLLGLLIFLAKQMKVAWLTMLLFFNPGDIFRLSNLIHLENLSSMMGLANLLPPSLMNGGLIILLFILWLTMLLTASVYAFNRQSA